MEYQSLNSRGFYHTTRDDSVLLKMDMRMKKCIVCISLWNCSFLQAQANSYINYSSTRDKLNQLAVGTSDAHLDC